MATPNSAHDALLLLRKQRHSFLNHLQVMTGWLQLEQPQRARQYLNGVAARLAAESEVLNQVSPEVGLFVLSVGLEAETFGVLVDWQVQGDVAGTALEAGHDTVSAALLRAAGAAAGTEGERRITVRMGPEGVSVHTPSDMGEG